ncbi:hypothetical protein E308F_30100 [Moorella sp. E308F]|uniref:hypothetical protein n=1 Tax=Moorella sp. E308F TaxID=2572682 RepID=UPI0010FFBCB6|nr:hypothetical protein [Moorella sp. E308F]GEA16764.1 hypothetical protein E308F_30100 [Moorella sp. E308F]
MAGVTHDYLIYPILELIHNEIRKINSSEDSVGDIAAITLHRDHPADQDKVTAVDFVYDDGRTTSVYLQYGSEDASTYPVGITPDSLDYTYYLMWRLTGVILSNFDPSGNLLSRYRIGLLYDAKGLLVGTEVNRLG